MSLTIDLNPTEEARLQEIALEEGVDAAQFVKNLVSERLKARNGASSVDTATLHLFEEWAKEDALLTPGEREKNDLVYAEIEKNGIPRVRI